MADSFDPYYQWLGIPPRDQPPHYYRLLAIELFESNSDVIEHAADRQMAHLRTFQSGQHARESQHLLNEVAQARVCLLSPDKKRHYDDRLRIEQLAAPREIPAAAPPPAEPPTDEVIRLEPLETGKPALVPVPAAGSDRGGFRVVATDDRSAARPPARRAAPSPMWLHPAFIAIAAVGIVLLSVVVLFFAFTGGDAEPVAGPPPPRPGGSPVSPDRDRPGNPASARLLPDSGNPPDGRQPGDAPPQGLSAPAPPQTRWPALPPDLARVIENGQGLVHDEFAMCQSVEMHQFETLVAQIRRFGYRPVRMRPYDAAGKTLVAALWKRDGLAWHMFNNLTQVQMTAAAQNLERQGYQPVDISGYRTAGGADLYASLWARLPSDAPERVITVGLTSSEADSRHRALRDQQYLQITHQLFVGEENERRTSMVWERNAKSPGWLNWAGNAPYYKNILRNDDLPVDVSLAIDPAKGPALLYAGTMYRGQQRHVRVLMHMPPDEHLVECRKLAAGGYTPAAIAALAASGSPDVVTSIWHWPEGHEGSPEGPQLAAVLGGARVDLADATGASASSPPVEAANPGPAGSEAPPPHENAAARAAEPDAAALAAAKTQIEALFAQQIRAAAAPAQRVQLATDFMKRSDENNPDPVRFGLMVTACELATAAEDYDLAFQALDALELRFETDASVRREAVIRRAMGAAQNNTERARIARLALSVAERTAAGGNYDMAITLANHASTTARRARETELAKNARLVVKRYEDTKTLIDESVAAQKALATAPADGAANAIVGRYLCFVRSQWDDGLPYLAKGDDSVLAAIAKRDSQQPPEFDSQLKLGDDWMKFADRSPEPDQSAAWRRARHWFELARASATGVQVQALDNRLAALSAKTNVANSAGQQLAWLNRAPGLVASYDGHTARIVAMRISRDGESMITGGDDRLLCQWNVATGQLVRQLPGTESAVSAVAYSPDEQFVLANGISKGIGIWNAKTGNPAGVIATTSPVRDMALSAEGRYLVFAMSTGSNNVGLWDFPANRPAGSISSPGLVTSVAVSYDERQVATATSITVTLWDSATGRQLFVLSGHNATVTNLVFSPKARFIATTSSNEAMLWDPKTGKLVHQLKDVSYPRGVDFSPDGSLVAVGGWANTVHVYSTETGEKLHNIGARLPNDNAGYVDVVRFLPDPRGIVLGYSDGRLRLWRLPD